LPAHTRQCRPPCLVGRAAARIGTSASTSTTETFKACADAPLTLKHDLDDEPELNDHARAAATTDLMVGLRVKPRKPNTGKQRITGPTPPAEPFNIQIFRKGWPGRPTRSLRAPRGQPGSCARNLRPDRSRILTPAACGPQASSPTATAIRAESEGRRDRAAPPVPVSCTSAPTLLPRLPLRLSARPRPRLRSRDSRL